MKRRSSLLAAILLALPIALCAQATVPQSAFYTWPAAVTGTAGQMGQYITIGNSTFPRPGNYTVDASISGTAPATCTFRVEGSSDFTNWYGLDVSSPSTTSCTASFMESIAYRPVMFLRIYLTYTQGDATTKVVFHWTGGQ